MAGNLSRFLKLERPRKEAGEGSESPINPQRFAEEPSPPSPIVPTPADTPSDSPADTRARELATGLALESPEPADAQPFVRCAVCESDSGKFATQCGNCGRPLDTPQQKAFNHKLWELRLAQEQLDNQEVERLRTARIEAWKSPDPRDMGVALASYTEARERERLAHLPDGPPDLGESIGLRLLRRIPHPKVRLGVALAILGLGGYALYAWINYPDSHRGNPWEVVFFVIAMLFIPRGLFGGRRRYW